MDSAVLQEMNRRLATGLREAEQEKQDLVKQIKQMQDADKKIKKETEDLCTLIITKSGISKEKQEELDKINEKGKAGRNVPEESHLEKQIRKASVAAGTYFDNLKENIEKTRDAGQKMLNRIEERTERIRILEEKVTELQKSLDQEKTNTSMVAQEIFDEIERRTEFSVIKKADCDDLIRECTKNISKRYKIKINLSKEITTIQTENTDQIAETVTKVPILQKKNENGVCVKEGPKILYSDKDNAIFNKENEESSEQMRHEIEEIVSSLTDNEKLVIKAMGTSGLSQLASLQRWVAANSGAKIMDATFSSALRNLTIPYKSNQIRLVLTENFSTAGTGNLSVYKLSETGKAIYTELNAEAPHKSEWDLLIEEHGSLEHAYGIKRTAEVLAASKYVKSINGAIEFYTRKKYRIKVEGEENSFFIPDIVMTYVSKKDKKTKLTYFEYETGNCTDHDMIVKLNKIARYSDAVFFIVPSQQTEKVTKDKIGEWRAWVKKQPNLPYKDKQFMICICTYAALKNGMKADRLPFRRITGLNDKIKAGQNT